MSRKTLVNQRIMVIFTKSTIVNCAFSPNNEHKKTPPFWQGRKSFAVMVLNYECMRKLLIALEEQVSLNNEYNYIIIGVHEVTKYPALTNLYSPKEIAYCFYMLIDAGMLNEVINSTASPNFVRERRIDSITYKGHEFLQKIKSEAAWNKAMNKLKPLGIISIDIISQVISNVIGNMIA